MAGQFRFSTERLLWVLSQHEYRAQAAASAAPPKTNFPEVPEGRPLGIITIEDVIEELLQQVGSRIRPSNCLSNSNSLRFSVQCRDPHVIYIFYVLDP